MERNYTILTEAELIALFREGEMHAFTEVYERYAPLVYNYAKRTIQDEHLVEDIIQEVFIILWEMRGRLEIVSSLKNYMIGITKFQVLRSIRKSKRFQIYVDTVEKHIEHFEASPEDYLINKEGLDILHQEIKRLPPTMSAILDLSTSGEYSYKEISAELNIANQTIRNNVTAATKILRLKLQKFWMLFI